LDLVDGEKGRQTTVTTTTAAAGSKRPKGNKCSLGWISF